MFVFDHVKGSGRAFCAGGDVVGLYHLINQGWRLFCYPCMVADCSCT